MTQQQEGQMKMQANNKLKSTKDPIEKLRLQCLSRGCRGIKGLGKMFHIIDDTGDRKLSFAEFKKGLHDYGINLEDDETKQIFEQCDTDSSGNVNFDEFLILLRPPMSQQRKDVIEKAFKKVDRTGDGVITVDDIKHVYDVKQHPKFLTGEMTKEQIFKEWLKDFEGGSATPDGRVTKDEFLNYYSGVSASIDNDAYFDLMMRNAWKI